MSAINELKKFIKDHSVKNVEESFNEDDLPNEFEEDFEVCESKCAIDRKKFNKYLKSKGLKESKSLKESSSKEDKISKYVEDYFDNYSDAFREVVVDLIERVDDFENLDDSIYSAIDEGLIYNEDQWEVMKHYQVPSEADYDSAIEELTNDLCSICKSMLEDNEEDEDLEESYNSLHEDAVSDLKAFIKKHQIKEDVNEDDLPNEFEEDIEENELNEDASKKIAELKKQLKAFSKR